VAARARAEAAQRPVESNLDALLSLPPTSVRRPSSDEIQAEIARSYNVDATTIGRLEPRTFERPGAADRPSAGP
jgi:hypothetical protein